MAGHTPRRIYEYPCEHCGEMMTSGRRDKRFCSPSCIDRAKWKRNGGARRAAARKDKTCGYCGKTFTPKRNDAQYCSPWCRRRGYYRDHREAAIASSRAWVQANPEKRKATLTRFAARHPMTARQYYARLKADPARFAAHQEYMRQYYLDHRDEAVERARRQRERQPTKGYDYRVGGDWDEIFGQFWQAQDGRCYLCRDPLDRAKFRGIHLDHSHLCCRLGRSCEICRRGLACPRCNFLIGRVKDDPEVLRRVADNLERANGLVLGRMKEADRNKRGVLFDI